MQIFVKVQPDIKTYLDYQKTAAEKEHWIVLEALFKNGFDINAKMDDEGNTVLHLFAKKNKKDLVEKMIESAGAEKSVDFMKILNNEGEKAIELTTELDIRKLLWKSVNLNEACYKYFYNTLDIEFIKYLVDELDADTRDSGARQKGGYEHYPFHYVVKSKDVDLAIMLLTKESWTAESIRLAKLESPNEIYEQLR